MIDLEKLPIEDPLVVWTATKPTTPGLYWVWQPEDQWPCRGKVYAVEVEVAYDSEDLVAWVPFMDYTDPVSSETWDGAMWAGPITKPEPPK